ncbi:MAG TPA: hypothetical protein VIM84_14050 [Gemmatimonadales bacterium]
MRTVLLPLAAVVAVGAGCSSAGREKAAPQLPKRDLTLVTQTAALDIASPVELGKIRPLPDAEQAPRAMHRTRPAHTKAVKRKAALAIAPAPPPVVQPADTASRQPIADVVSEHELPPGRTVTVIPASTGPSAAPEDIPGGLPGLGTGGSGLGGGSGMGGRGCPGRGAGPAGIRPPPSLYY